MLTLQMDAEIERRLEALGARTEASKTALARQKLLGALDEALRRVSKITKPPAELRIRHLPDHRPAGTTEDLKRILQEVRLGEDTLEAIEEVVRSRSGSPARVVSWDDGS